MRQELDRDLESRFRLDDGAGPARPIDDAHAGAIIAAALIGAGFAPAATGAATSATATTAKAAAGGAKLALIGGGLAAGIAAIAIAWWATRPAPQIAPRIDVAPVVAPAPVSPAPIPAPPVPVPAPVIEPPAPPDEIAMPPVTEPAPHVTHHEPAPTAKPEDLLAEANRARAAHAWKDADARYAEVVASAPRTLAAQTALVASAALHLEHLGDAAGAAKRFRSALAMSPRGALAEDARWGLAEAARAQGDRAAEAAALDDFLAHHAGSPLASVARKRRAALP
ncbi:MAG: hypothetical protein K8W52_27655 [Deltaproteobacteria bacterium]|nr:hypothetical protein [Deltaproteobacteria bacterium]